MEKQYALSICDAMELFMDDTKYSFPVNTKYLYVGSYFCARYFVNTPWKLWKSVLNRIEGTDIKAVLVIPLPGQMDLEKTKKMVSRLLEKYGDIIKEIVVNDYGMLHWVNHHYSEYPIWCGRLMSRDYRDPRFEEKFQRFCLPLRLIDGKIDDVPVVGVEGDPVTQLDPVCFETQTIIGIHFPFVYLTMGRICEIGSLGEPLQSRFRLYESCRRQCANVAIFYEQNGIAYIKQGTAVFAKGDDFIQHISCARIRYIYSSVFDIIEKNRSKE